MVLVLFASIIQFQTQLRYFALLDLRKLDAFRVDAGDIEEGECARARS